MREEVLPGFRSCGTPRLLVETARAVFALGEIAPEPEAKQVILAGHMNGKPLATDHLRVVVSLDNRGGRSVREVARIEVTAPSPAE
jgi:Oxidoreductase molybdopterin binding domain